MCGLVGIIALDVQSEEAMRSRIGPMVSALEHRGPDNEGVWIGEGMALAHRRLSVVDLSEAGLQPMMSTCGRYIIAYNGEIYNYLELRELLSAEGVAPAWRGHSDTETLLSCIEHWGIDETLRKCYGMFAIALYDRRKHRLLLARDRTGEKPLYWGWAGNAFVFGSELKAIRKYPGAPREPSQDALALYFRFGYVPAPYSIHPGLYKLEAGCVLETTMSPPRIPPRHPLRPDEHYGELSIRRYWSFEETLAAGKASPFFDHYEALSEIEQTLSRTIKRQMLADVPIGAFLSGGVDSSLIVSLMQQNSPRPIQTFTIGFENAAYNEAPHAASVAHHLGTEHTEITVTEIEAQQVIQKLPVLYDEPFADSSQIPTYLVCKAARSKVTVALSGDGGDELFCGYNRYFWGSRIWNRFAWFPFHIRALLGASIDVVPLSIWDWFGTQTNLPTGRHASFGDKAYRISSRLREIHTIDDLYISLVTEWKDGEIFPAAGNATKTRLDDPIPEMLQNDPVGRMMLQDIRTYLPDDILCKVDRAAMGVGLETRVPFLDPDMINVACRLPAEMRSPDGRGKWALRQVLQKHVPQEHINRPKSGFGIPIGAWLRGPLRDWAEELLASENLSQTNCLETLAIRKIWTEHLSGHRDWTYKLWIVLMFQAWLEETQ